VSAILQKLIFRHVLQAEERPLSDAANLMYQLVPLTNLPKVAADLNTFFIPTLADLPASQSSSSNSAKKPKTKSKKGKGKESDIDATPDWMAFYESGSEAEEDDAAPAKAGTKRRIRTSHMSIHASVHSIASHQTVYTALWETVLSQVRLEDVWIRKVLVGLHGDKGILSNMKAERRVRFTDWLGSLIDGGGANAMLAMNGLYVLMTQYNL
jgi:U3 small nucleolar RNA-associated protein 19